MDQLGVYLYPSEGEEGWRSKLHDQLWESHDSTKQNSPANLSVGHYAHRQAFQIPVYKKKMASSIQCHLHTSFLPSTSVTSLLNPSPQTIASVHWGSILTSFHSFLSSLYTKNPILFSPCYFCFSNKKQLSTTPTGPSLLFPGIKSTAASLDVSKFNKNGWKSKKTPNQNLHTRDIQVQNNIAVKQKCVLRF